MAHHDLDYDEVMAVDRARRAEKRRRAKVVRISYELFHDMLTGLLSGSLPPYEIDGWPEGGEVLMWSENYGDCFARNQVAVLIHSPTFPITEPGDAYPEMELTVTRKPGTATP